MTDREKAIVMAHTGICMLTGKKFEIFHKYIEDIMERPIMTHEIGWLADVIKEKSKADFIALCASKSDDAISRQTVLDKINEVCFSREQEWVDFRVSNGSNGQRDFIIKFIEDLSSVQPKPNTGQWIVDKELGYYISTCSNCGWRGHGNELLIYKPKYCPNCGTKMLEPYESEK